MSRNGRLAEQRGGKVTRVLVVEDEPDIADLITRTLERAGDIQVDLAMSGEAALEKAAAQTPAAVVLDLNLPVLDGLEVCRILRTREESATVPIIMLTARASEADRVRGLDIGADDYVTKPFSPRELAARVRAAIRRGRTEDSIDTEPNVVYDGAHLTADFDAVAVSVDGEPIRLTRREFELLRCLIQNRNRVMSRDRLLERVWGYQRSIDTRAVDVHVARLRAKLGSASGQIETLVGLGYRFAD